MKDTQPTFEIKVIQNGKEKVKKFKKVNKALEFLKQYDDSMEIKLCHIGGNELLRDGTKTEICSSFQEVLEVLEDWGVELSVNPADYTEETLTDFLDAIEDDWNEHFDDGGGSGWIEY